jgi:hypothetical protein
MEDVLAVYARPFDPARPLVCFDERGKELQRDTRPVVPASRGQPMWIDSEYERNGRATRFLWTAPLPGRRGVTVMAQRTRVDWAVAMRRLVEEAFPAAERIVLVLDKLNTHKASALDQAFPPAVARQSWEKLEVHYTPVHGSWLTIAECELSVLRRQGLGRRIADRATLEREASAWASDRNTR